MNVAWTTAFHVGTQAAAPERAQPTAEGGSHPGADASERGQYKVGRFGAGDVAATDDDAQPDPVLQADEGPACECCERPPRRPTDCGRFRLCGEA
jgi:hypothetical protein